MFDVLCQSSENIFDQFKSKKPFIICCAHGYIVDYYGPFPANDNDSKILNYILETDEELKKLLVPNKTLFLIDRDTDNFTLVIIISFLK